LVIGPAGINTLLTTLFTMAQLTGDRHSYRCGWRRPEQPPGLSGTTHTNVGDYRLTWTFANANYNSASG
jgi:hypothetical protein